MEAGTVLHPSALSGHDVVRQYVKHQSSEPRPSNAVIDIGAFEFSSGSNQPPVAVASGVPTSAVVPLIVSFDSIGSDDPDGTIVAYDWDFGDGENASGPSVNHTYQNAGNFTATLTVTDNDGASDTDTVAITVNEDTLATPVLSGSANRRTVTLNRTSSGAEDGFYLERGKKRRLFRVLSGRRSQIEFPTVEVDGVDEVLLIAETARRGLDPLNP